MFDKRKTIRMTGPAVLLAATFAFGMATGGAAATGPIVPTVDRDLSGLRVEITSDRCIQLEEQFDSVKDQHSGSASFQNAMSYREKGSYLCNADVDQEGEEMLERALRVLGVEPDPVP